MMAIVQFLLMVIAAVIAALFAHNAWQIFQAGEVKEMAITVILSIFFAGAAALLGVSMTEEAEKNYKRRQRQQ